VFDVAGLRLGVMREPPATENTRNLSALHGSTGDGAVIAPFVLHLLAGEENIGQDGGGRNIDGGIAMRHVKKNHVGLVLGPALVFVTAFMISPSVLGGDNSQRGGLAARVESLEALVAAQASEIASLRQRLACVADQSNGTDLVLEGCNLHLRNGAGATNSVNMQGNLIIGYNENSGGASRLGSHNLIVGPEQAYDNAGGLAVNTGSGSLKLDLNRVEVIAGPGESPGTVLLKSGVSSVEVDRNSVVTDSKDITLKASGDIDIKAAGQVTIKGSNTP
jgi:hypothetical protein